MKQINKVLIIIALCLFGVTQLMAQVTKTISGSVTDENGTALQGVSVIGDEGDSRAITDADGSYTIKILFSDVVLIEKDGFNSKTMPVSELMSNGSITLEMPAFLMGEKNTLELPFRQLEKRRSTGSVTQIDVNDLKSYDARQGLSAALTGHVPGAYGSDNLWGRGGAVVVVDGVPRVSNYDYWLREIESVTVLKDPVTRSMYGAWSDAGVIMVTTKRGKAYKSELNFQGEYGVQTPKRYTTPEYMNAADYMETYNTVYPETYSATQIQNSRDGVNPTLYPDVNLYNDEFVKNQVNFFNLFGEASGGNENAQYYLNLGWQHNENWMALGDQDTRDRMNVRGNVDYRLTHNFKMNLDAVAIFDITKSPNVTDFWSQASTLLPNAYPLYWHPALITDETARTETMENANLVNGMLLGGNQTFNRNIYGDLTKKGNRYVMDRNMQVNLGADWDLNTVLPGLKAKGFMTFDFFNKLVTAQSSEYAVYNPLLLAAVDGSDSLGVQVIGEDKLASNYAVQGGNMTFHRRVGMYGALTYDQSFGDNDVSLMAVGYRDQFMVKESAQYMKNLTFGLTGNIVHKDKFLLDFSLGLLGTQKLAQENRYAFTPSLGLGWILSEEDFLADSDAISFLKLRANAGILKNDNWGDYWLYTTAFNEGGNFVYNNGVNQNRELNYNTRTSNIGWQGRQEFSLGFDASMFDHKLWLEGSVFHTKAYDLVTQLGNRYPSIMGTNSVPFWGNYNANRINGFEFGLKYKAELAKDVMLTVGSNLLGTSPLRTQVDEPFYANEYQYREGTPTNAMWGLASDGLYGSSDFDAEGNLLSSLPTPSWGAVAPGDIKYIDKNSDGLINSEDVHIIGQNSQNFQYSLYFNLKVKNIELYAMGYGQLGNQNMRSGDYYRTYGDLKYPEHLKEAYSVSNPDVNAAYPRLTAARSNHNFQTSDFWMYDNNWFSIPVVQLTYTIKTKPTSALNDAKIYLRGTDVVLMGKNIKYTNVSVGNAPKTSSYAIGFMMSF